MNFEENRNTEHVFQDSLPPLEDAPSIDSNTEHISQPAPTEPTTNSSSGRSSSSRSRFRLRSIVPLLISLFTRSRSRRETVTPSSSTSATSSTTNSLDVQDHHPEDVETAEENLNDDNYQESNPNNETENLEDPLPALEEVHEAEEEPEEETEEEDEEDEEDEEQQQEDSENNINDSLDNSSFVEVLPLLHRGSDNTNLLALLESITNGRLNRDEHTVTHTLRFTHISPQIPRPVSTPSTNPDVSPPLAPVNEIPPPPPQASQENVQPPRRSVYVVYRAYPSSSNNTNSSLDEENSPFDRLRQYLRVMFVLESLSSFEDHSFDRLLNRLLELHQPRGPPPTSKEFLENIPEIEINDSLKEQSGTCSVCFDEFETGISANQLPCKHLFHKDCIKPWLVEHNTCPVCRHALPTEEEEGPKSQTEQSPSSLPLDVQEGADTV